MQGIITTLLNAISWLFREHLDSMIQIIGSIIVAAGGVVIVFVIKNSRKAIQDWMGRKVKARKQVREQHERKREAQQQVKRFVEGLKQHPDISRIQILNMPRPLNLLDVYVPLRIHHESMLASVLDPALREAEETSDPNALFEIAQRSLEHRVDSALDPYEAIRQYRRCVIIGGPGTGKTTLLHYLTLKAANNELPHLPSLPIYLQLSTFDAKKHKNLLEYIFAQVYGLRDETTMIELRALLLDKMSKGEVFLLLDGLDETKIGRQESDEHQYTDMIEAIKELGASYPDMPIVVTVRKANYQYRPKLLDFYELEVVEFRLEDSKAFVKKWFEALDSDRKQEKIKDLTTQLERSLRIQSIASNPLLMSLILIVYEGNLHLPERRSDLYKQCIEALEVKWDASRDIQRRKIFPVTFQPQLLQTVAWELHTQGKRHFPKERLQQIISKFMADAGLPTESSQKVLEQIAQENGLLREYAYGWYGFSHLTFQEFFVTQYIIHNELQAELLKHVNDFWWEEVFLLYVGSISNAGPLLSTLLGQNQALEDDIFYTHLLLAGRCLSEKPVVPERIRISIINRLFDVLYTTPYTQAREQVAITLAIIGGPQISDRLLRLLVTQDDDKLAIRESVCLALGQYGERSLAAELAHLLTLVNNRYMRVLIVRALGVLGVQSIAPHLLSIVSNESEDPFVRQCVALSLGMLGGQDIAQELIAIFNRLRGKKDIVTLAQQGIVIALGMSGNLHVAPQLQDWLRDEEIDLYTRGYIAKALSMLGRQESVPVLLSVISNSHDNAYVRRRAATALASFECNEQCIHTLLSTLHDASVEARVRSCIALTLEKIGRSNSSISAQLLALLCDEQTDAHLRISLATALGHLEKSAKIIETLNDLRQRGDLAFDVRGSIIAALGLLGERSVLDELLDLMAFPNLNHDVMLQGAYAIANLSHHQHIDKHNITCKLINILALPDLERYRGQQIARLLSTEADPTVIPALFSLLTNTAIDIAIRQEITNVIAQIADDPAILAQLETLLTRTDIGDDIYRTLWILNRKLKTHIQQLHYI